MMEAVYSQGLTTRLGFAKWPGTGEHHFPVWPQDGGLIPGRAALRRRRSLLSLRVAGWVIPRPPLGESQQGKYQGLRGASPLPAPVWEQGCPSPTWRAWVAGHAGEKFRPQRTGQRFFRDYLPGEDHGSIAKHQH
jgi:hypothetical protein